MSKPETDVPFRLLDWALLLGSALIWGASFLFIAIGLEAFSPGVVTFLRVATGAVFIGVLPGAWRPVEREDLSKIAWLAVTWIAFPLTMFPIAQQWIDSSLAGMLNAAMPLGTVAISWLFFATPTGVRRMVGVAVGVVGVLLIGIPSATTSSTHAIGVALVLAAIFSYGFAINIAGPLQRKYGSMPVLSRALVFSAMLVSPYAVVGLPESTFAWGSLFACIALGAGGTGLALVLATKLTGRVGSVRASMTTYVIPVVATVLGIAVRGESVTVLAIVGTVIVLLSAWLSTRSGRPS
ncbi:MAG: drug/metabolite transporter (DMT)-like permease [Planctomycetota bacterium]|jgi:drug/metabolite transporter (DMT)-like permease